MGKKNKNKQRAVLSVVQEVRPPADYRHVWAVFILCALGFLIYSNTFQSTFHFDDLAVIVNNPAVRKLWDIQAVFNAFNTRVVTGWTFALNYAFGGLDVFGYHFFNIWLHVCNSALVYFFVLQLLGMVSGPQKKNEISSVWVAFFAALIFLAHPLQTQAVNYVWQRSTLLATFFYLTTLYFYVQARIGNSRWHLRVSLLTCLLAMLSKEIAFTLPLMIVAFEFLLLLRVKPEKRLLVWVLPFLIMLCVIPILLQRAPALTLAIMKPHDAMHGVSAETMAAKDYLPTQVNVLRTYLRLFVWPVGQNVDYDYPLARQSGLLPWAASAALLGGIMGAGVALFRRYPLASLSVGWFFLTVLVESLVTSADVIAEHRMYLPMAGLSLGLGVLMMEILCERNLKGGLVLGAVIVTALAVLTFQRNFVWENDVKFWGDAIEKSPHKARPFNNRGVVFKTLGFLDLALSDFNRAIVNKSDYPEAYYNRAGLYKMKAQDDLALADYGKVIELEPRNAQAYSARGYIYRRKGMLDEALKDFNTAIALNPQDAETYNNRAYIHQKNGNNDEAIMDYSRAIKVQPDYIYAFNNRGNLYLEKSDYASAIADYDRAVVLKPDFAEAYMNRAVALYELGRFQESREGVQKARALGMTPNSDFVRRLKQAMQK